MSFSPKHDAPERLQDQQVVPRREVVFDTTCLAYLTLTGHDDLLAERYGGRSYIPDEVRAELERGERELGLDYSRLLQATWWKPLAIVEPEDLALFFVLLRRWGREDRNHGEAAAIVLARRHGCVAIIDDAQGRKAAQAEGVPFVGTIGILARLAAEERLSVGEAWRIHTEMVAAGFRSPLRTADELYRLVERLRTRPQRVETGNPLHGVPEL